jgi:small subunit ribosomal protein S1
MTRNPDVPDAMPEDWWNSILAEENLQQEPVQQNKKEEEKPKPTVDWKIAESIFQEDRIVLLKVVASNRGGLLVEGDGIAGFVPCSHLINLPASQIDSGQRDDWLLSYIDKELQVKVIECVPGDGRLVLSERAAQAGTGSRVALLESLEPGQRVIGLVTNVTDFGVFVDLGGIEGLVHISELSWGRVVHPNQVLHLGEHVEVLIMNVLAERSRIALSLKRLQPNPWETAEIRYPIEGIFPAVITSIVPFGVFARLEEGLEGLIHISEIPLIPNAVLTDVISPGQSVQVRILLVDPTRQRLSLSLRTS